MHAVIEENLAYLMDLPKYLDPCKKDKESEIRKGHAATYACRATTFLELHGPAGTNCNIMTKWREMLFPIYRDTKPVVVKDPYFSVYNVKVKYKPLSRKALMDLIDGKPVLKCDYDLECHVTSRKTPKGMIHYIISHDLVFMFTSHALERMGERISYMKRDMSRHKVDVRSPKAKSGAVLALASNLDRILAICPPVSGLAGVLDYDGVLLGYSDILEQDAGFIKKDTMVIFATTFINGDMAAKSYEDLIKSKDGKIYIRADIGGIYARTREGGKGPKIIRELPQPPATHEASEQRDQGQCSREESDVHYQLHQEEW